MATRRCLFIDSAASEMEKSSELLAPDSATDSEDLDDSDADPSYKPEAAANDDSSKRKIVSATSLSPRFNVGGHTDEVNEIQAMHEQSGQIFVLKGRKRTRDPETWKCYLNKKRRQAGQEYTSRNNVVRRKREFQNVKDCTNCKFLCHSHFPQEQITFGVSVMTKSHTSIVKTLNVRRQLSPDDSTHSPNIFTMKAFPSEFVSPFF